MRHLQVQLFPFCYIFLLESMMILGSISSVGILNQHQHRAVPYLQELREERIKRNSNPSHELHMMHVMFTHHAPPVSRGYPGALTLMGDGSHVASLIALMIHIHGMNGHRHTSASIHEIRRE